MTKKFRKRKLKRKQTMIYIIVIILLLFLLSTGYAILNQKLTITGKSKLNPEKLDNSLKLKCSSKKWQSGNRTSYDFTCTLTNNNPRDVNGWYVDITVPFDTVFQSGWDGEFTLLDSHIIVKPKTYNAYLSAKKSIPFGFIINTTNTNFAINNNYKAGKYDIDNSNLDDIIKPIDLNINAYLVKKKDDCHKFEIGINNKNKTVTNWQLEVGLSDVEIIESTEYHYVQYDDIIKIKSKKESNVIKPWETLKIIIEIRTKQENVKFKNITLKGKM